MTQRFMRTIWIAVGMVVFGAGGCGRPSAASPKVAGDTAVGAAPVEREALNSAGGPASNAANPADQSPTVREKPEQAAGDESAREPSSPKVAAEMPTAPQRP